jgi:uncharacterized membrane protein YdjX (TVP38/TMEM64 family)
MPQHSRRKTLSDAVRIALVLAFFLALGYVLSLEPVRAELFDVERHRRRVDEHGFLGALVFIGAAGLLTGLGVPRLWISVAAGGLFGAVVGIILGHFSSLLGATLNFLIARWILRGPIKRRMPDRMKVWYQRFNRHGFRNLLYLRLFPLSNATVTNVIGGVSSMRYRDFIAATFIGYLPLTIVFAVFGSSAAKQQGWQFAVGAVLLVILTLAEKVIRRRLSASVEADDAPAGDAEAKT